MSEKHALAWAASWTFVMFSGLGYLAGGAGLAAFMAALVGLSIVFLKGFSYLLEY